MAVVTVLLPRSLRGDGPESMEIDGVATVAELVDALDRHIPGVAVRLDDALFSVAVNDELLLHQSRARVLRDGDRVEFLPVLSGGVSGTPAVTGG